MATRIVVPALGESIVEATVGKWFKKPGDRVEVGETLVEIETDKINLEVGAEASGVLREVAKEEGQDVRVGELLGTIEPVAEEKESAGKSPSPATRPEPAQAPPEAEAPQDVPTSREDVESAEEPGGRTETRKKSAPKPPGQGSSPRVVERVEGEEKIIQGERMTPLARRLADDYGLDTASITGSGAGGRITREDIERVIRPSEMASPEQPAPAPTKPEPVVSEIQPDRREERIRMSRRRRTIAQRMVESQQTAAILTTFNDVDMSAIQEIRKRRKEPFREKYGVSLGIVSFFVKTAVAALKEFPRLNAEIQDDDIIIKHYYDIGIAVGAEEGLVVPVLREADRLSFAEIETAIQGFVEKARQGSFTLDELRGGTFTITNGGVFGSLLSTPILNYPEVAILGLHRIEERPVAVQGQVSIRPMMYLALSYDHRIVDGREAVQFLARIKNYIENPDLLLVGG